MVAVAGTDCGGAHVDPPFEVFRITALGPPEEAPTAVQCWASAHETPVKSVTIPGYASDDHVPPPSEVAMMLGEDVPKSVTAVQVETVTHETDVMTPTPAGTGSGVQIAPASVVPMTTGLPKMPKPTAVQSDVVAHEIPLRPLTSAGIDCWLHAYPSLTDARTALTPTAKQSAVLGQETEFKRLVPAGGVCAVQDNPPVVVPMMVEPAPLFPVFPTAMQSSAAEHEIPVRSTAFAGGIWSDHVEPLFDVPTT